MRLKMKKSGKIIIDGKSFTGNSVSINNDKVFIDGVKQEGSLVDVVNITIHGDVDKLDNNAGSVNANNVGSVHTMSGSVQCRDVAGDVNTMSGSVRAEIINGDVETVSGKITTK